MKNDVNVVSTKPHDKISGVETIEYQMPALDKTGKPIPNQYQTGRPKTKTVYDPDIISDDEFARRGIEAANDSASRSSSGSLDREWTGVDNQGVTWRGYTENDEITSMYPE